MVGVLLHGIWNGALTVLSPSDDLSITYSAVVFIVLFTLFEFTLLRWMIMIAREEEYDENIQNNEFSGASSG